MSLLWRSLYLSGVVGVETTVSIRRYPWSGLLVVFLVVASWSIGSTESAYLAGGALMLYAVFIVEVTMDRVPTDILAPPTIQR